MSGSPSIHERETAGNSRKGCKGDLVVEMDPKILKKVCEGFLKNAIENTPDEGKIEIELRKMKTIWRSYISIILAWYHA